MRRQLERDGYEQPLDLDGLLANSLSVFFVENAFVGHVLIDDQQAPAVICDDIAVMDLPENPGSRQIEWTRSKFGGRSQQHVGPYAQTAVVLRILRRSRSFISEGIVESPLEWIGGRTGRREIKWCGFRSRPGGPGAPREIASRNRSLLPRIAAMLVNRNRFTPDQRALDRIQNQIVDEPLLSEADLGLGRMRVDIHLVKGQLHEEKHDRIRRGRNAIPVGLAHGACDQLVPHHAAIYVEELRVRIRFLLMRPRAEAIDLNISRAAGDLHEILQETLAKELVNPVLQRGHRDHIEQRAPVALKREAHLGVGQGIVGYEPGNVSKLRIVGAQKLPARRHVEKEVPDRDFSPLLPRDGLNRSQRAPLNFDFRSRRRRIGRMAGPENQSGY